MKMGSTPPTTPTLHLEVITRRRMMPSLSAATATMLRP
jgi:hypothetical protein